MEMPSVMGLPNMGALLVCIMVLWNIKTVKRGLKTETDSIISGYLKEKVNFFVKIFAYVKKK